MQEILAAIKMRALNIHIIRQKRSIKAVEAQFGASEVKKNQFLVPELLRKEEYQKKLLQLCHSDSRRKLQVGFIREEQRGTEH